MAQRFEGTIGDDWRDSEPWWPPEPEPPAGAPNVVLVVLDDVGFAQLGCYGSDIATPNIDRLAAERRAVLELPHHRAVLADALVPAHRPQPPPQRHGPRRRPRDRAIPGYSGDIPRENGFLSEILRAAGVRDVRGRQVAPHARRRDAHGRRPQLAGRSGAGFDRWYGFHGGETHQFVPDAATATTTRSSRRARSTRATTSARISPTARSSSCPTCATSTTEQPFFLLLRDRRVPLTAPRATGLDRALPRAVRRRVGRVARARRSPASSATGIIPPGTALSPRPAWVPAWDDLHAPDQAVAARFMECFAAFLSYTDDADRPRARRSSSETGDLDNTMIVLVSDNGASSEGGVHGSINDARIVEPRRRPVARSCAPASTSSAARPCTTTIRGAGPWPATRRSGAGSARSTRAASPIRASCAGRDALARRGAAASAASSRTRSTCSRPSSSSSGSRRPSEIDGVAQRTDRRHELRVPPPRRRRRRARAARHAVLRDARLPRRSTTEGWKAVTFKSARHDVRRRPTTPTRPSTTTCGSCTTWPRTRRRPRDLAERRARTARRARRPVVGGGGAQPGAPARQPHRSTRSCNPRPAPVRGTRDRYVYRPFGAPVPESVAVNVPQPLAPITADVDIADGRRRRGRAARDGLACSAGRRSALLDGRLRYVHNLYGKERHAVIVRHRRSAPGRHALGFRVHEDRRARRAPARCSCDGEVVGEGDIPHFTPTSFNDTGAGLTLRLRARPRDRRRLRRAVPVQRRSCTASSSTCGASRTANPKPVRSDHAEQCTPALGASGAGALGPSLAAPRPSSDARLSSGRGTARRAAAR